MRRLALCCGIVLVSALQIGCYAPLYNRIKCQGCGDLYMGAYVDNPPRCEPCDDCGSYTGCNPCCNSSRYPWNRARMFQALHDQAQQCNSKCCGGNCGGQCDSCTSGGCSLFSSLFGGCGKTSCTEASCGVPSGEVGCGTPQEVGCGTPDIGCGTAGPSYSGAPANGAMIEQEVTNDVSAAQPAPPSTPLRTVSRPNVVNVVGTRSPQRCNCGKVH